MGNKYFSKNEIEELNKNPYVKRVSEKSISYSYQFKDEFWQRYNAGESADEVLKSMGFDPTVLGNKRVYSIISRLRAQSKRKEGFLDTRTSNSGRRKRKK